MILDAIKTAAIAAVSAASVAVLAVLAALLLMLVLVWASVRLIRVFEPGFAPNLRMAESNIRDRVDRYRNRDVVADLPDIAADVARARRRGEL